MELVKLIKNWWMEWRKNKMKFDIHNVTTGNVELGVFAESPQMLKMLYDGVGEDIIITNVYKDTPQVKQEIPPINNVVVPETIADKVEAPFISVPFRPNIEAPGVSIKEPSMTYFPPSNNSIKTFTDNGIEYMIKDDISYKKSWVDVDSKNFRVINTENNKEVKLTNKKIQTLDWVKIG